MVDGVSDQTDPDERLWVLDGGLATELEFAGFDLDDPLWSGRVLLDREEAVAAVHEGFFEAGCDVVTTASYQLWLEGLVDRGLSLHESEAVIARSVEVAKQVRDTVAQGDRGEGRQRFVAASIGPYGAVLADGSEYRGQYGIGVEALMAFHQPRLSILIEGEPDWLAFETIPSAPEIEAIARLMSRHDGVEWTLSVTTGDPGCLADGTPLGAALAPILGLSGLRAVGVNCIAPAMVSHQLDVIREVWAGDLLAAPNRGESWDPGRRRWTGQGAPLAQMAPRWLRQGARYIGGCCRVRPVDIAELVGVLRAPK